MNEIRQNIRVDTRAKKEFAVACGERLRIARQALGEDSIRAFAETTGVEEDTLGAWELGKNQVPPWYIQRLKRRYGVTHEYIFGGDLMGLPDSLVKQVPWPA